MSETVETLNGLTHTQDERTWAALAHASVLLSAATEGLGGMIAAAAIWLTQKDKSAWVAFHGLQALVFQGVQMAILGVVLFVTWVVGFVFGFATFGLGLFISVPLIILVTVAILAAGLAGTIYGLYGAYQVYTGHEFLYLWIGDWLGQYASE